MTAAMSIYRADFKPIVIYKTDDEKVEEIIRICARLNGVTPEQVKARGRKREVINARHLSRHFIHHYTNLSLRANVFKTSGINHSSVIHSLHTVSDWCDTDPQYKANFITAKNEIEAKFSRTTRQTRL